MISVEDQQPSRQFTPEEHTTTMHKPYENHKDDLNESQSSYRTATNASLYLKPWIGTTDAKAPESSGKVPMALATK